MAESAPIRWRGSFDRGWKFHQGDASGAEQLGYDDAGWRRLDLPHDWSIEGPFDQNHPCGGGGGYLPGGVGWYRKVFRLPPTATGSTVWIEFDGVYKNADVYLNGHHLGFHPYGYTSFHYDLTPYLNRDGTNILAVCVDDSTQPDARWYTGAGIYRHVWLSAMAPLHVAHWGTFALTHQITAEFARLEVLTRVQNETAVEKLCTLVTRIVDPEGNTVAEHQAVHPIAASGEHTFAQRLFVEQPRLWSVEDPYLYTVCNVVKEGNEEVDDDRVPLGIRDIRFDADRGFFLNGKQVKLNGVCLHHDGGCVGAAVPERVWERRLKLLKAMGCNAIRSSHYPPAPEFLDLCDRMGFLVMDESFDEWKRGKFLYGYHDYYDEWAAEDMRSMLRRDRNHPSIVLWSVGNEIPEQSHPEGPAMLQELIEIVRQEDPSRPVTSACDHMSSPTPTLPEFAALLDVVGYNYVDRWGELKERCYADDRHRFPGRKMIGSENSSIGGIRGDYSLTQSAHSWYSPYHSRMIGPEQLWKFTRMYEYVAGDFMWTGIDYLGETRWPHKNASSGVIDTCGFPKDGYYFYQSQWTIAPMLHLFPHWTWPGREGEVIPVICYTNCESVELFLNGKSYGIKACALPRPGMTGRGWNPQPPRVHLTTADLHLAWDVPYEPGVLKAVGRRNGEIVAVQEIVTAGPAARIELAADREVIAADGRDVAHVTVRILDAQGHPVPVADNLITFQVEGEGRLIGVDNGNPASHEPFQASQRRAFNGLCLGIVQATETAGEIRVEARSQGLEPGTIVVRAVR